MTENPETSVRVGHEPMVARTYGYLLGSKDNFQVDREFVANVLEEFPLLLDIARQNRMYLYRAVQYLATEVGITQFLDLGSGLPTDNNVHQVAQEFNPDARVVYVDNDPLVLTHGHALLADNDNTTVVTADMTQPEEYLDHPETRRLLDLDQPVGVLMFSIPHCIPDDEDAQRAIHTPMSRVVSGSHLAISHVVADTDAQAAELTSTITRMGMPWNTRTPAVVDEWLAQLEPVSPGLGDIAHWRPAPGQPALPEVVSDLVPYLGAALRNDTYYEYGGVLAKP